jgi:hypothetical protein
VRGLVGRCARSDTKRVDRMFMSQRSDFFRRSD